MGVSDSSLIGALLKINITHIFDQQIGICRVQDLKIPNKSSHFVIKFPLKLLITTTFSQQY